MNDTDRHGEWHKDQERYEDGSKSHSCGEICVLAPEAELGHELYGHYLMNAHEDAGYYYREADETGLLAVYKLGLEHGQKWSRGQN